MWCNFVHAAREETPTELYEIPGFQWQLQAVWGSEGAAGADDVILSIWSSRQRYAAYDPSDQSGTANTEATTLFISKPAGKGTGGYVR